MNTENEDQLLSDEPKAKTEAEKVAEELGIEDVSVPADPGKPVDLAAWFAGVTANRRACTLYARGDLQAARDALIEDISDAEEVGPRASDLREELAEANAQIEASSLRVVIEGRDEEWIDVQRKRLKKAGVTDKVTQELHMIAAQIVEPEGVTADMLIAFRKVQEPQIRKLLVAWTFANQQPVEGTVTPGESQRPSAGRRTRRS